MPDPDSDSNPGRHSYAYTGGHQQRVNAYALEVGRRLGLTMPELEGFGIDPRATRAMWQEAIQAVVGSWPGRWNAAPAEALGLPADLSLDGIIDDYLADFS